MSHLVVFAFDTETGAQEMRAAVKELQKQELIKLEDAAIVIRKEDGKVKVKQATSLVGAGALGGAFWGMLIGLIFWIPWLGLVGAVSGAVAGYFTDIGIDDDFIKKTGSTIKPGNSALFLLIAQWTEDKVLDQLEKYKATVLKTSLSKDEDEKLRAAFGAEEVQA